MKLNGKWTFNMWRSSQQKREELNFTFKKFSGNQTIISGIRWFSSLLDRRWFDFLLLLWNQKVSHALQAFNSLRAKNLLDYEITAWIFWENLMGNLWFKFHSMCCHVFSVNINSSRLKLAKFEGYQPLPHRHTSGKFSLRPEPSSEYSLLKYGVDTFNENGKLTINF